jgi:hypothetical protein
MNEAARMPERLRPVSGLGHMGCRSDYVGSTSGVPQKAADLSRRTNSAALGPL